MTACSGNAQKPRLSKPRPADRAGLLAPAPCGADGRGFCGTGRLAYADDPISACAMVADKSDFPAHSANATPVTMPPPRRWHFYVTHRSRGTGSQGLAAETGVSVRGSCCGDGICNLCSVRFLNKVAHAGNRQLFHSPSNPDSDLVRRIHASVLHFFLADRADMAGSWALLITPDEPDPA